MRENVERLRISYTCVGLYNKSNNNLSTSYFFSPSGMDFFVFIIIFSLDPITCDVPCRHNDII